MLFSLIKNELIKLMKKAKTWIVFALFAIFICLTIFSQYKSDKSVRAWNSPENKLENAKSNLEYYQEELKVNKNSNSNPDYIQSLEESIVETQEQMKNYEDMIKNGIDKDQWKKELDQEIKSSKETIAQYEKYEDEWSKKYMLEEKERLENLIYLKENNIEPIYGWEYEAYNYMNSLMRFLGMAILVCGIAVFMSDIVSGECTPATLKFLLIQPVSRGKVLLSKFISVTLVVLAMILGGELLGFAFVSLTSNISASSYPMMIGEKFEKVINADGIAEIVKVVGSGHMGTNLELFIKAILLQGLFIVTVCAVVFLISTLIKSSMITMAVSVVVTVFLTIASQTMSYLMNIAHLIFVNYGDTISILTGDSARVFRNAGMTMETGIIVMLVTIVVSYLIAYFNFRNKDILI